jgi:hypothetical protein
VLVRKKKKVKCHRYQAISTKLIKAGSDSHPHLTTLAAIWGQFVANDISYTLPLSGYEKVKTRQETLSVLERSVPLSSIFMIF